jgi:hypothetical protein
MADMREENKGGAKRNKVYTDEMILNTAKTGGKQAL